MQDNHESCDAREPKSMDSNNPSARPHEERTVMTWRLEDVFCIEDLQRIQDTFAEATGVAAIITTLDRRPITERSNACRLCEQVIKGTAQGL